MYLKMTDEEAARLTWIHSNKFTVPELFRQKFLPRQTYRNACYLLNKYVGPDKGFLHVNKADAFFNSYFYLTKGAIRALDEKGMLLVRSTKYEVRINPYEREHDFKVQNIRIAFERNQDLENIFWVSDFEMRSGITPAKKAKFLAGELDKERWRSNGFNPNPHGRRTPDGYFEANLDGQRMGFTLEFENKPYYDKAINAMVGYLEGEFPEATKLVVSASKKNALRMIRALQLKVRRKEQDRWFISDFDRATTFPFKQAWHQLDHSIGE